MRTKSSIYSFHFYNDGKNTDVGTDSGANAASSDKNENKDKDIDSDANAGIEGINKNKYKNAGADAAINAAVISINKHKNLGRDFDNLAADKVGKNVGKQLKISKSILYVPVINRKKFYLLKKIKKSQLQNSFNFFL